jgi:hypothetical protein
VSCALVDSAQGIVRVAHKVETSDFKSLLQAAVRSLALSAEEQAVMGIEEPELLSP